jgi:hypothetical protein
MPAHHRRSRAHRGPASVGPRGNSRPYRDMQFAAVHESAIVKVFGCRPRRTMPQALAASAYENLQGRKPRFGRVGRAASGGILSYGDLSCGRTALMGRGHAA